MPNKPEVIHTDKTAQEILFDPLMNKGSAFTIEERKDLGLLGLLPHHVSSMQEQLKRRYQNFIDCKSNIDKYKMLTALQDRNEVLFYRLAIEHIDEMLAYIYTPTVGEASLAFSLYYNQSRGIYIPYEMRHEMPQIIKNIPKDDVDVIVVTDGSRILGLGDLGAGGMTIPVGKLALYTIFGGVHPAKCLPILLDIGTDNPNLLKDPLYIGWRHERVRGEEYEEFMDLFVSELKMRYPKALLQWEDFSKDYAKKFLLKYKEKICSFNDDIQGTAASVLAGIQCAIKSVDSKMKEQKIVIFGAGSAGCGIARILTRQLMVEGVSEKEARSKIYLVDYLGLITNHYSTLSEDQKKYVKDDTKQWKVRDQKCITLEEVVKNVKPTILIGTSAQSGSFSESIVKEMAQHVDRPIIFPLSNPTALAEAVPEDLIKWTDAKALVATGSPFPPVHYKQRNFHISQCNNVYIFPAIGLGISAVKATKVLPEMFLIAADVLSSETIFLRKDPEQLFPRFKNLREVTKKMAIAVGKTAVKMNVSSVKDTQVQELVEQTMWFPNYPIYTRAACKRS